MQATQEGLVPLKAWVKNALDQVVQVYLKQPDLGFAWVGDDAAHFQFRSGGLRRRETTTTPG
jgi:hypothetical protein